MNTSELSQKELDQIKQLSIIPNTMYVWHKEDGSITGISNSKSSNLYLEVEKSRLKDFLSGKKDYCRYNINYFKFDTALQVKEDKFEISLSLIYTIPKVTSIEKIDCVIIHDAKNLKWEILLNDYSKSLLARTNPNTVFEFHLTSLNDPHYLYTTLRFYAKEMLESQKLPFNLDIEHDINSFSIATYGFFKSYGVLEK